MAVPPFGLKLKELRQRAGVTQPKLAELAGLSTTGVALIEQGRREPGWSTVVALAEALGVDCREFQKPAGPGAEPQQPGRPKQSTFGPKPADRPVKGAAPTGATAGHAVTTQGVKKPRAGGAKGKRTKGA